MSYKEDDVAFEKGAYWALADKKLNGWKLFRIIGTHSESCGFIHFKAGLLRVESAIDGMIAKDAERGIERPYGWPKPGLATA